MADLSIEEQIEAVLEQVRPLLRMHKGGIELVDYDDQTQVVRVKFQGMCVGCPLSEMTLKGGIEAAIKDALPVIKEVVSVE